MEARLFSIYLIVLLQQYLNQQVNSTRGQTSSWFGSCGNPNQSELNKLKQSNRSMFDNYWSKYKAYNTTRSGIETFIRQLKPNEYLIERMKQEPIVVRLNIVYDTSFESQFKNHLNGTEGFIRNFVYATQLIFEQPEFSSTIRLNLVVVSIKRSSFKFEPDLSSDDILTQFRLNEVLDNSIDRVDVNALFVYRHLWRLDGNNIFGRTSTSTIYGLARTGVFCRRTGNNVMILTASSLGSSITFAHELAHSMNVNHDGDQGVTLVEGCSDNRYIMSPAASPERITWSECSTRAMQDYFISQDIANCIYDTSRVSSAKPINAQFDLNPLNPNRGPFPGELIPIDEQCKLYVDKRSISELTKTGKTSQYTTCQSLQCVIDEFGSISIGSAPAGSLCTNRKYKLGSCSNGSCVIG